MYPVLLRIGTFAIHTYGLFVALGLAAAVILFTYQGKRSGLKEETLLGFSFWVIISGIVGARLSYVVSDLSWFLKHPGKILLFWQGGLALQGGVLFAILGALTYTHRHHLSFWRIADIAAPPIALGLSIGRIGCFLNGCCYGRPWLVGFVFPLASPAEKAFPGELIIPTQLISSVNLLVIFLVLTVFRRQKRWRGGLFPAFLLFYSVHRFGIEFLRGDHLPIFLHLTLAQLASIFMGILALALLWKRKMR